MHRSAACSLLTPSTGALLARHSRHPIRRLTRHYAESSASSLVGESERHVDAELPPSNQAAPGLEGWLWVDSVFPARVGTWDIRYLLGYAREDTLLTRLRALLSRVNTHGFKIVSLDPYYKDGGVFVKFKYSATDAESALPTLLQSLQENVARHGGIPSWAEFQRGNVWLVKGRPWKEDLKRYPSPIVKISFDGPDVSEEQLYRVFRPFGTIQDISQPTPVPAGTLRSSLITFKHLNSSTVARNAMHAARVPSSSTGQATTLLRIGYQAPIQAHVIRDYVASHPRIFLPVLFFILGTFTYTVFDPIRVLMVEGKMNDWFDYKAFTVYKWLRKNTFERFAFSGSGVSSSALPEGAWKERRDAEDALEKYLSEFPSTIAFVHGPQGSGKTSMLRRILKENKRKAITIDIGELSKANSEAALVSALALQTGYWPVFSFLNSISSLVDLASVGLIGQKAGMSTSLTDQLKQILDVVGRGLSRVNGAHRKQRERHVKQEELKELREQENARIREEIKEGRWHDGRLDVLAGNGVMSELGMGIERFGEADADAGSVPIVEKEFDEKEKTKEVGEAEETQKSEEDARRRQRTRDDVETVESMPIIILKNFETKGGGVQKDELLNVLAQWAASIAENQIAHVVVISDNRENVKRLAKALPSKPLNQIALSDADKPSALSFLKDKLNDIDVKADFTKEQISYIERLGGRASDLESLIHKVRSGLTVEEAVEDIIVRGLGELRKNAFGDDAEDAKSLPWSREQAWILMKRLSKQPEIPYHEVLVDFPFKGDETPLRNMEHSELITIGTFNGRPSTIRPGKPIYKYVFERLVQDPIFQATQDIAFNEKVIASSESTVKACEDELLTLKDVDAGTSSWWGSHRAVQMRATYLLRKMRAAEDKIETLERQNAQLKKVLAKQH